MDITPSESPADSGLPKFWDQIFLLFLACVIGLVAWIGVIEYREGHKTESIKRHGEAWGEFFKGNSAKRTEPDYSIEACAAKENGSATWGDCYQALVAPGGPMDGLENPFFKTPQKLAQKCDTNDRSTVGALVLEKLTPLPLGSAVPIAVSAIESGDRIDKKLQIRVSVCDKFSSPIVIGEFQF